MNYKKQIPIETFRVRNEYCTLISNLTGVPVDDIMGRSRREDIVLARFLLMWVMQALFHLSATDCGIILSKHYGTCINARNKLREEKYLPPNLRELKKQILTYYNEKKNQEGH